MTTTHMLETPEAEIAYDVHGPLPAADGRPPLVMIAQPMDASGFGALASHFPDRTVVTYDPRGLGRSTRKDGRVDHSPSVQANDVHAVIEALGAGPVEMFASSGGAVTALALVAAYPDDVVILVAHEPPLIPVLPDGEAAERARAGFRDAYEAKGSSAGMAAFMAMTSWRGEFTDEYFAQPAADPVAFGMPTQDDGSRDDPLLSDRSWAVSSYRPDVAALAAAPTRVVIAVGEESLNTFTGRTAVATGELLGQQATVFPSHHGGFLGGEFGYAGQPEAFARKLRDVLDDNRAPRTRESEAGADVDISTFVFRLKAPRPTFALDMSDEEREIMGRHAAYWQPLVESGEMVAFGPVLDSTGSWGLGVIEADDEDELRAFAAGDPVVTTGTAEVELGKMLGGFVRPR